MAPACPVDAAARCASNAASEQRRLVASHCELPRRLVTDLLLAFEADRPRVADPFCVFTKAQPAASQPSNMASARDCPRAKL